MNTTFIYMLIDPRNDQVRYIGKADNPVKRFEKGHLKTNTKTKKASWIKSLLNNNLNPVLEIVDEVPANTKEEWSFWERHYISLYKSWGFNLTNMTDGGDCPSSKKTIQSIEKQRLTRKKRTETDGFYHSPKTCEKISKGLKGNTPWNKGKTGVYSEETNRKRSLSHKGKKQSLEVRLAKSIKKSKPVLQYNLEGKFIKEWPSAKDVQNNGMYCKGAMKRKRPSKGFFFFYKQDNNYPLQVNIFEYLRPKKYETN